MKYVKRNIENILIKYLRIFPAVGLTGPRQSGKSTMLINLLSNKYEYVTFDDIGIRDFFYNDPEGFLQRYSGKTIFDEVQYVPELFSYIKIKIDRNRNKKGQYVLTGSSNFAFLKSVSESLAGRIGLLTLFPFEYSEIPVKFKNISLYKGSYPELLNLGYKNIQHWYSSYINTYLEKDVRSLSNIGDLRDFLLFLKLISSRTSQLLILTEISREIGVAVSTIKKWVSILEASYIIFLLKPFYKNIGKRLVKSPKVYFYDTGLAVYLSGLSETNIDKTQYKGMFFENYIISELVKKNEHLKLNSDFYFLRTSNGAEVDIIKSLKGRNSYFEIKSSATMKQEFFKIIRKIIPDKEKGYVIYQGQDYILNKSLSFINYKNFLK